MKTLPVCCLLADLRSPWTKLRSVARELDQGYFVTVALAARM
jgi:hypothetical protein